MAESKKRTSTPAATELRGKVVLGDSIVREEIAQIDDRLRVAADNEKTRLVIREETPMTTTYNYGNWYLLEELFLYGPFKSARMGSTSGEGSWTSIEAVPGYSDDMTQPELFSAIKSIDKEIFPKHARINAVLAHYRKLGYQIHPGNWFNALEKRNIIWVINWNNTILDHITLIDNSLVIGKTTQRGKLGNASRDGSLDAAGRPNPVGGGYRNPEIPQTRIEFFGLGNKASGIVTVTPADGKMGTNNVNFHLAAQAVDEANKSGDPATIAAGNAAAGGAALALIADLAGAIGKSIGDLTKTGLFHSELGQGGEISAQYGNGSGGGSDFAEVPGFINTGDGEVPDIENVEIYQPDGNEFYESWRTDQRRSSGGGGYTGEKSNLMSALLEGGAPLIEAFSGPSGGGGGGGGSSGGGSGNIVFSFVQTSMPCAGCGWLFSSSQLSVSGSKGSANIPGPGFLAKVGRGTATIRFSVPSSVGKVNTATLYLRFNTAEGIANGDFSSVVKMSAGGRGFKTLTAGDVKAAGYSKARPNFPIDVTGYVRSAVGSAGGSSGGRVTTGSFLWKPISEKRDIAILIGAVGGTLTANGIQASYSGQTNGNRATFRIPWSSGLLDARNIIVKHSYGGSWTVPVGNQRYTA